MQTIEDIREQVLSNCKELDEKATANHIIRDKVIAKLSEAVTEMKFDPSSDPASSLEAKTGVITTLLKAINDSDSQMRNTVKVKQSIKSGEDDESSSKMLGQMVAEVFRTIKLNTPVHEELTDLTTLDTSIDDLVGTIDVTDGEVSPVEIATNTQSK